MVFFNDKAQKMAKKAVFYRKCEPPEQLASRVSPPESEAKEKREKADMHPKS
jgi:hypothetical protein